MKASQSLFFPMMIFRPYRLGARVALALMILWGILPVFASLGAWVCPDGSACPWMNDRVGSHTDGARTLGRPAPACCPSPSAPCCPRKGASGPAVEGGSSPGSGRGCRFVSADLPQEPARFAAAESLTHRVAAPVIPPIDWSDLLAAWGEPRPDFPRFVDFLLSPSPLRAITPSRAPPSA